MDTKGGKYRDIVPLGHGGMGDIVLALHQGPSGFQKLQVIKRLRPELAANSEFVQMLLHEARIAARLSHPNIVQTNEVGQDGSFFFIAMEYLEGQTLHALFRQARRLEPNSILPVTIGLRIVSDALEGLHYAHELKDSNGSPMGLVHRDISPGNIFVTYDGTTKVLDFGIAKAKATDIYTQTGVIKGKVPYMAPERFYSRTIDRRSDLYSMGAVLWDIAAGTRLWTGQSDMEIIAGFSEGYRVPSPRTANASVHPKLEAICSKALGPDRNRYATAAEMQADIEALLRELGGATTRAVAQYVSNLFSKERSHQQAVIQARLHAIRREDAPAPASESRSSTSSRPPAAPEEARFLTRPVHTNTGLTASQGPPPPAQKPVIWLLGASLVTLSLAGVGVYWMANPSITVRVRTTGTSAGASTKPSIKAAERSNPPSVMARTRLYIQASPADTLLYLDDEPLMINPYAGDVPRDGLSHRIRAEAKGFTAQTRVVQFYGDNLEIQLRLDPRGGQPDAGRP